MSIYNILINIAQKYFPFRKIIVKKSSYFILVWLIYFDEEVVKAHTHTSLENWLKL